MYQGVHEMVVCERKWLEYGQAKKAPSPKVAQLGRVKRPSNVEMYPGVVSYPKSGPRDGRKEVVGSKDSSCGRGDRL